MIVPHVSEMSDPEHKSRLAALAALEAYRIPQVYRPKHSIGGLPAGSLGMANTPPRTSKQAYTDILDWATRRTSIVKCTPSDIYRMHSVRSLTGRSQYSRSVQSERKLMCGRLADDHVYYLDQQPCRTIETIGWVSAISFEYERKESANSDTRMVLIGTSNTSPRLCRCLRSVST
jgi:hypothetical protein